MNTGNPVFLDEFSPSGTLVQSIAMPTVVNGTQKRLIASGTAGSEGQMTRSADGRFLVLPGYDATPPHTGSLTGSASSLVNRVIGRVDADGNVDTSTALTDAYDGNNFRGVASNTGLEFWVGGNSSTTGGVRYVASLGTTTSTLLSSTNLNLRMPAIFDGQLYVSSGNGSTVRLGSVGSGLPTTSGQVITSLPGYAVTWSPNSFVLLDMSTAVAGVDTLYTADDGGSGSLQKFSFDGTAWTARGSVGVAADLYRGLIAKKQGSDVLLYAVRKGGGSATGGGELVTLTDTSGSTGTLTGTPTLLATAATNTAYRGVAFAPEKPDLQISLERPALLPTDPLPVTRRPFSLLLKVQNTGGGAAYQVSGQLTLPAGLSFVSASTPGFSSEHAAGVFSFSGGTLAAGAEAVLSLQVQTTTAGEVNFTNGAAEVDAGALVAESNEANNTSALLNVSVVDAPDMSLTLSAPNEALTGPSGFDYTLTATNSGALALPESTLSFPLPPGISFVSGSAAGFSASESAGTVSFTGGTVAADASVVFTVRVTAAADGSYSLPGGAAQIAPSGPYDSQLGRQSVATTQAISTEVRTSDLSVAQTASAGFQAGEAGSYTITVSNGGTGATAGLVSYEGTLPAGLTATGLSGTGWTITQGTGSTVTATRSDALPAGQSYPELTLNVSIATNAPLSVTTTARVSGGGDHSAGNNEANTISSVLGAGPGVIAFEANRFTIAEESGPLVLTLRRTNGRTGAVSVQVSTTNGSATAGSDFTGLTNVLVEFADNTNTATVAIPITADSRPERNETFQVTLSNASSGATLGTTSSAEVLILEPDAQKPRLSLLRPSAGQRINEGAVTVSGQVTDNQQVARVQLRLNAGDFTDVPLTPGPSGRMNFLTSVAPVAGLNVITLRAADLRGNDATEVQRSFTYVVKRPLTLASSPLDGGSVTISPNEPLAQLEVGKRYTLTAKPAAGRVWNGWASPQLTLTEAQRLSTRLEFTMREGLSVTAAFVSDPFLPAVVGDFSGLVRAQVGVTATAESEGAFAVKITPKGAFTGTLRIAGANLPFAGVLDTTGVARFGSALQTSLLLSRAPQPGYVVAFTADLNPAGSRRITGSLRRQTRAGSEPLSEILAHRHAGTASESFYTFAMPAQVQTNGLTSAEFPQGDGIGTLTLTRSGLANVAGVLADGTVFTASTATSAAGDVPLFLSLESGAGSLNGWLKLDATLPDTDVTGQTLRWFKPVRSTAQHYPQGWPEGVTLSLIGARFAVPEAESVLPDLSTVDEANALLTFSHGALSAPIEKELSVSVKNLVSKIPASEPSYSIRLVAATGRFSGSFLHSDSGSAAYEGVILQKGANRRGYGHFLTATPKPVNGSGQAGAVHLRTNFNRRLRLVISELMANNESTLADDDGDFSDWIEIYNPGSDEVDLTDWCLTDNATVPAKWRFPAVTLGAREFLLVWASSKNRRAPGQPLHTNFNLSAGGEYLALVRPDGVTVEHAYTPMFPAQANDESFGINFNGRSLISQGAAVKYRVPANDALGSTWTAREFNDGRWSSGRTGLGFGVSVPGFTVRQVAAEGAFGEVRSVAQADALLALPAGSPQIASQTTVIAPVINYLGDGSDGNYGSNQTFPNGSAEPFAFLATGTIQIPTTGNYVFGLNSDDGGRIKIDGVAVMTDDSNHGPLDNLSAPVSLTAGPHTVEVLMWEGGGGDCVEFFAKAGTDTSWNDGFKLVGSAGGLQVTTAPLGAGSANSSVVGTNVERVMRGKNATLQARLTFPVENAGSLSSLTLRMRYNDGFVAWLNGTEILRRNAPAGSLSFNSTATTAREPSESLTAEVIDLSAHLSLLISGRNVLAIQGLNASAADSSFLLMPELNAVGGLAASPVFFRPQDSVITATPGAVNGVPQFTGVVQPVVFSQKHGFYSSAISLALSTTTPGAVIRYTLDGSTPTASHGAVYKTAITLSRTSIVRAAAFRAGYEPTRVNTQSFFFLNDVIRQSSTGARPAAGWPAGTVNGQVANYGMDPQIVNSKNPAIGGVDAVKNALLALPTVSLVSDLPHLFDPATGIWVNPEARGFEWERPCSLELIGDGNSAAGGFQVNCGMRIRGGFSRSGDNPKHAFHFYFRGEYGASKLDYPLFGNEGVDSFDKLDLRTSQNYSWSFQGDGNNTFMREETARELQGAMGQPYTRSRNYHLYINGQYWGIFNSQERADTNHNAAYLGGDEEEWDVVKSEAELGLATGLADGTIDAWQSLWNQARAHAADPTNTRYFAMQGRAADGVTATADPVLLDPVNLIDYMLLTFWTGNFDGATSAFLGDEQANNWQGARRRGGDRGFVFYAHDFEHSFFSLDEDRTGPFPNARVTEFDLANPMFLHHDLRPNAEYRMKWADQVQKHFFDGGALAPQNVQERLSARAAEIRRAIIAESARWGDAQWPAEPFTKVDWENAAATLINDYAPQRGSRVLAQLRADGLYPSFDAPTLSQHGGPITSGDEVIITGQGGTIYYTLDGSDPRQVGGTLNPAAQVYTSSTQTTTVLPLNQTWRYLADGSNAGTAWRLAAFDDSAWSSGAAELGYGDGDEATVVPFVDADPIAPGMQKNATTYFRTSFEVADATGLTAAVMQVKYDDAVILYLNGSEVARSPNLASGAAFDQYASTGAPDENAFFTFNLDPALLITGTNVLAAEVHQAAPDSIDLSFQASLAITRTDTPTPLLLTGTGSRTLKVRARQNDEWSALVEAEFDVRLASDLEVSLTPDGLFSAPGTGSYRIVVSNNGSQATSGTVSVTATLPAGLNATSLLGPGWTITQGTGGNVSARRGSSLPAGESFPDLTLAVAVAAGTAPFVTTSVSTSGGGEVRTRNNSATHLTAIQSSAASQILLSSDRYSGLESSGPIRVTLQRTGSPTGTASVRLRTQSGTARSPSDFEAQDLIITFSDGETTQNVDIDVTNDRRKELHEHFTVLLDNVTGSATLGLPNQARVTLLEEDTTAPTITLTTPSESARVVLAAVTLTGRASDNKGLSKVQVALNDGAFADALITLDARGTGASFSAQVPALAGANTVRVRAVDASGLIGNEIVRRFTYVPLRPLALTVLPANGGRVAISPAAALTALEVGKTYTLTATPGAGFLFDRWAGSSLTQKSPSLSFTMSEDLAFTAHFATNSIGTTQVGDYQGLVQAAAGVEPKAGNHGLVTMTLAGAGGLSGQLRLGAATLPFTGAMHPDGSVRFGSQRSPFLALPQTARRTLRLRLGFDLNARTFTGRVDEETRTGEQALSTLAGAKTRAFLPANSPLLTNQGRYAVTMTQTQPAAGTNGFPTAPTATLAGTLTRQGRFTLTGTLSDGSRFTGTAALLETGFMPLHVLLPTDSGSLGILLEWEESPASVTGTTGRWFRPVAPSSAYPFGWPEGIEFSMESSR